MLRPATQLDYLALRHRAEAALARNVRTYATTGRGPKRFGQQAEKTLTDFHARAIALGRSKAGGTRRVTAEDRSAARQIVSGKDGERTYLKGFVKALQDGKFTDDEGNPRVAAVQARISLYARKLAGTANQSFVDSSSGALIVWTLGRGEHCADCVAIAAGSPYEPDELPTMPGNSDTQCHSRCHCRLVRNDGVQGFTTD